MGRPRKNTQDWRLKVQPELLEMLGRYRDTVQSWERSDKTPDTARLLEQELDKQLSKNLPKTLQVNRQSPEDFIYSNFSGVMDDVPFEVAMAIGMVEKIHWLRFREPFWVTYGKYQSGNLEASERIHRTLLDYDRMRLAGKQPKEFKTNYDHDVIFSTAWGHGLENLNEEELAECFNEFCPCGQSEHDGHALRMQRDRMFRALATSNQK